MTTTLPLRTNQHPTGVGIDTNLNTATKGYQQPLPKSILKKYSAEDISYKYMILMISLYFYNTPNEKDTEQFLSSYCY